jgi:hypothetical protein
MKIIEREMQIKEHVTADSFCNCQASFNSHGCITIRNYNALDKNKDKIICLSDKETRAIIDLFRKLKEHDILPF